MKNPIQTIAMRLLQWTIKFHYRYPSSPDISHHQTSKCTGCAKDNWEMIMLIIIPTDGVCWVYAYVWWIFEHPLLVLPSCAISKMRKVLVQHKKKNQQHRLEIGKWSENKDKLYRVCVFCVCVYWSVLPIKTTNKWQSSSTFCGIWLL